MLVLYDWLLIILFSLLLRLEKWGYEFVECVSFYYEVLLKYLMFCRFIDVFEVGSYSSILKILGYIENLCLGCIRVMSLVEEVWIVWLFDGLGGWVLDDLWYSELFEYCGILDMRVDMV